MYYTIEAEHPDDAPAIEALLAESFGPDRKARTVYQFRDGIPPLHDLCFAARQEADSLVASIRFWPVQLPDGRMMPMLGPLAVSPALRGQGVGRQLVQCGLEAVEVQGYDGVLIVGSPDYYAPFGFSEDAVAGLEMPGPVAPLTFMGRHFTGDSTRYMNTQWGVLHPWHEAAKAVAS